MSKNESRALEDAHTVMLHGKRLVSGLVWQPPVARLGRGIMQRQGRTAGFGLAVRHTVGQTVQVGYGVKEIGKPGFHSLAAVLATVVEQQDWIGAFRLSDTRYVLVGVRQGAIMAGRDVVGARGDVEALLRDTVHLAEDAGERWDAIYAPKEFDTPWQEVSLARLLPKSALRSSGRLESLTGEMSQHQKRVFLGVAAGLLAVAAGGWAWHAYVARMARQAAALEGGTITVPPPHPWKAMATVPVQLSTWRHVVERVPLFIAGWRAQEATLDAGTIAVTYRRSGGMPVAAFQAAATGIFGPAVELLDQGEQAKVKVGFASATGGQDDVLHSQDDAFVAFTSHFQSLGMAVPKLGKRKETPPEAPAPVAGARKQIFAQPDWQSYEWATSIPVPRPDLLGNAIPGLRLTTTKITFSDGAPQWALKGVLYVKD
ncbi:type 4b pilus protein PilO2 [Burkholderia sp. BCC0044]|uniref:type 4b pilus protein PilO2 n=1 Tax=Burkholderia sp. BCC0044 TaxID=2676295 RepID=UPI00158C2B41|nr:type 4b pilus protein PilO2 [Burkholderia sp. BCC0044]